MNGNNCVFFKNVYNNTNIQKSISDAINASMGTNTSPQDVKISSILGTGKQGEAMKVQGFSYVYTDPATRNKIVGSYTTDALSGYTFTYNSEYSQTGTSDCKQLTSSQAGNATMKTDEKAGEQLYSGNNYVKIYQGNWSEKI